MTRKYGDLIQDLERVNMWIGNCDQKSSFLLTMVGVVATIICTSDLVKVVKSTLVIPFVAYWKEGIGGFSLLNLFIVLFLVAGLGLLFVAIVFALLSLMAKTDLPHFKQDGMTTQSRLHYGSIAKMTYADYLQDEGHDYKNDLRSQIYVNSMICDAKIDKYKTAMKLTLFAMPLLVVAFLLLLFA